tara:strand:+ start:647 stop:1267 length:621 start_codon:yes stop_codon:yes gene_type:complete
MTDGADPRRYADAPFAVQRDVLVDAVMANRSAKAVLERAGALGLPDWALMAGCVYKSVWNALTGRDPEFGINDYDLAYCEVSDLSKSAEQAVIEKHRAVFADIPREVELCNQARVPIWFSEEYGVPRKPITSTEGAVCDFASKTHCAAIRLDADGEPELIAPFGLDALFSLHVRPFPGIAAPAAWNAKCTAQKDLWPEIEFELIEV